MFTAITIDMMINILRDEKGTSNHFKVHHNLETDLFLVQTDVAQLHESLCLTHINPLTTCTMYGHARFNPYDLSLDLRRECNVIFSCLYIFPISSKAMDVLRLSEN